MKKTTTRMTFLFLALAVPALMASPAMADDKFVQMDTDKNGMVSWEEFHKYYPQMQKAAFEGIDANKDKTISHEEWDGFLAQHNMGRAGAPGGGMGGMPAGKGTMPPAGMGGAMPPAGMGGSMSDSPKSDVPPVMITPPAK